MKGFLQRLAQRAGGDGDGLRPRVALLFEPAAPSPGDGATAQPDATVSMAVVPAQSRERARPHATPSRRDRGPGVATPGAEDPAAVDTDADVDGDAITARPLRSAGPRPATGHPTLSLPAHEDAGPPAVAPGGPEDEVRPAAPVSMQASQAGPASARVAALAAAAADAAPRRSPRPSFPLATTVPRLRPQRAGSAPTTADADAGSRARGEPAPEPVVRVTIEHLDVRAVAATTTKRGGQQAGTRRDTLADYVRRRQEAKR